MVNFLNAHKLFRWYVSRATKLIREHRSKIILNFWSKLPKYMRTQMNKKKSCKQILWARSEPRVSQPKCFIQVKNHLNLRLKITLFLPEFAILYPIIRFYPIFQEMFWVVFGLY